jgi:hypothetical protein
MADVHVVWVLRWVLQGMLLLGLEDLSRDGEYGH